MSKITASNVETCTKRTRSLVGISSTAQLSRPITPIPNSSLLHQTVEKVVD